MAGYLVRDTETKELHGFFVATNLVELRYLVDEELSPYQCDYISTNSGGFFLTGKINPDFDQEEDESEKYEEFGISGRTENMIGLMEGYGDRTKWKRLCPDNISCVNWKPSENK